MTLQQARIKAVIGIVFLILGIAIGIELLLRPGALGTKLFQLAFPVVMIALGLVRVRMYLKVKSELAP